MSAEILRRAASLMRERAEAASPSPWEPSHRPDMDWLSKSLLVDSSDHEPGSAVMKGDRHVMASVWPHRAAAASAEHIASWHPAVALAVADWLDWVTEAVDGLLLPFDAPLYVRALAVARAYLGDDQ